MRIILLKGPKLGLKYEHINYTESQKCNNPEQDFQALCAPLYVTELRSVLQLISGTEMPVVIVIAES